MKRLRTFLAGCQPVLLHVSAVAVVAAACWLASLQSALRGFAEDIARYVVASPEMQLVAALRGSTVELVAWQRAHPPVAHVHWLQSNPELVLAGMAAALALEAIAWRPRKAC